MSSPRHFETAAEFCKLVGAPTLFDYLGIDPDTSSGEARAKLKKRRKYMQGMQSNPKYKEEALFLIKHFAALDKALSDPQNYRKDATARKESEHIPILEMTIRGVLAGGTLSKDQEDYLRRNALELGVSGGTFDEILDRLCADAGVGRDQSTPDPDADEITDYYSVLGVTQAADKDTIRQAYEERKGQALGGYSADQVQRAWDTLSDTEQRRHFDLARRRTGPPARSREVSDIPKVAPSQASTAPPVRPRQGAPIKRVSPTVPTMPLPVGQMARGIVGAKDEDTTGSTGPTTGTGPKLEILGDPVQTVRIASGVATRDVVVRNSGTGPMAGRVSTDQSWLIATPSQLDPNATEQTITIKINAADLVTPTSTGVVAVQTDKGDRASVVFETIRQPNWMPYAVFGGLAIVAIAAATAIAYLLLSLTEGGGSSTGLTITVDPTAEEILLDGRPVGSGESVFIPDPPTGKVTLTVTHPNFVSHTQELEINRGDTRVVPVNLELARKLDFRPSPEMTKVTLEQSVAQRIMGPRSRAMDACVRQAVEPGATLNGSVRIHVGPDGEAIGIEVSGDGADDSSVRSCLEREAAAVVFHKLTDGEYATVRYEYEVTEATGTQ